jgi:hypothetical protein
VRAGVGEVGDEGVDSRYDGGGRIVMLECKERGGACGVVCSHDARVEGVEVWERWRWDYVPCVAWVAGQGRSRAWRG